MSGIVNTLSNIASFVAPVLDLVKAIPGVGQIVGAAQAAISIVKDLDKAFSDFPMGLISVAAKAAGEFLPTPFSQIADIVADPGKGLMSIIPDGIRNLIPDSLVPAMPGAINDLVDEWI